MTKDEMTLVEQFFPAGSVILAAPIKNHLDEIDPIESAYVANAVEKRRAEFSTGRFLAHNAVRQLGKPVLPIIRGALNEPVWPRGVIGSISHTNNFCVVVATTEDHACGLGVDLEPIGADVSGISELVMRAEEIANYRTSDSLQKERALRLHFTAKEAIYKAVCPIVQRFIEFEEISIGIDNRTGRFSASAVGDSTLDNVVSSGTGICVELDEFVLGGFFLPVDNQLASVGISLS